MLSAQACAALVLPTASLLLWMTAATAPSYAQHGEQKAEGAAARQLPFSAFAQQRGVEASALARELGLPPALDLSRPLGEVMDQHGLQPQALQAAVARLNPVAAEAASKDWRRIRLKFGLWVVFFLAAMVLLTRVRITLALRVSLLALASLVFGVWLGVEPNAPGTIKDGLVLYGESGVIFPPRLLAFVGFMLMTIIGNKVFCGWGCQFGTLQDLVSHVPVPRWKPPFWLSNAVRATTFAAIAGCALLIPLDILEPVDPFRVFRLGAPLAVGVAVGMLIAGLFVYRPWCTFFCPFGLVSWLSERLALARVRINHDTCIHCKACERACPTHSMAGLRARRPFAQDCFACGACLRTCPVGALRWGLRPPAPVPGEESPRR
ncbi:MAG: 4Fe-4S dicluster domain-containing protein [Armatimonadetes bacterium]|nr:4Fe-4S dicluster domain-containing protein [Armatimonadota bacterium]